jgi:flavin-dependent dehydrogenase
VLDRVLVEAARAAGATVRHHVVVRHLLHDGKDRVSGVVARDASGREDLIGAGIVIGADGIGSAVARLAGAEMKRRGRASTSTLYAYVPTEGDAAYHWYFRIPDREQGPLAAGLIPTNDGQSCLFLSLPTPAFDATARRDPAAAYAAMLEAIDADLAARVLPALPPSVSVFRGRPGHLRSAAGRGWLLVGDAGFFRDPLTAHGITDALRDAEGAASAVIAGSSTGFQAYESERDGIAVRLLDVTEAIIGFDWDYTRLEGLHRQLNAVMKDETAMLTARGKEIPAIARSPVQMASHRAGQSSVDIKDLAGDERGGV